MFVPTASGDSQGYIDRFYESLIKLNCEPSHLSLFKGPGADLEEFFLEKDVLYVGGGNTRNLLVLWKEWKLDQMIRKAYEKGTVLAGVSAGSICWFEEGVTDSIPGKLTALSGLGFLKGSNCPHYDGELERRPSYHELLLAGAMQNGYATDDGAGLHFVNEKLEKVVTSRPQAEAYEVKLAGQSVTETVLTKLCLGAG